MERYVCELPAPRVSFEWHVHVPLSGKTVNEEEKKVSGEIEIPNLSEENEMEEITVSLQNGN